MGKYHPEMIYIGDPMCSWCWGFVPELEKLIENSSEKIQFRIIVGGLRPGKHAQRMDEQTKNYIRTHWQHVQEASGQPFDFDFFKRADFLYDTEPAARAVVAMRKIAPAREFEFFKLLQHAFYAQNVDITDAQQFRPILTRLSVSITQFEEVFFSDDNTQLTYDDFEEARKLGIQGFPALVIKNGERAGILTSGYQSYEKMQPLLANFLGEA